MKQNLLNETATTKVRPIPCIVAVGLSSYWLKCCREASFLAQAAVIDSELVSLSTLVSQLHPLAIVLPQHVYAFDPNSFEDLANATGSQLVVLPEEITSSELHSIVLSAVGREPPPPRSSTIYRCKPDGYSTPIHQKTGTDDSV